MGCGNDRTKCLADVTHPKWEGLTTLDGDPTCEPDIIWDLEQIPYPFDDNTFDEIHAYCVLEHCGRQGDYRFFFAQWAEFARILKPDGRFFGICPKHTSMWAWGDPSHTRIISPQSLRFLAQRVYNDVGKTAMSDYRRIYSADLVIQRIEDVDAERFYFVLQVNK